MTRFGYTRTSTVDKQVDDLQRKALIDAGVVEGRIHADQVSGSKEAKARPGWAALDARLTDGDELVVYRIDRIGRSLIDVVSTVEGLIERGVMIRSLSDGINPSTKEGRLMLQIMAALAEYERLLIQERVRAGVAAARANGKQVGRPPADPEVVTRNLRTIKHLIDVEKLSAVEPAKTVGWSKATYYRHRAAQPAP